MNPKAYLTDDDDRGVSPVIGVILMVAITVILAAVIASFVIGLGDNNNSTGPTTSVNFDYDASADELDIRVSGGENLQPSQVEIQGTTGSGAGSGDISETWQDGSFLAESGPQSELQAGSQITLAVGNDYDISVVYVNPNTQESFTLNTDTGPEA